MLFTFLTHIQLATGGLKVRVPEPQPADETFREYERVVDPNYLDEIRAHAKNFSTKPLSRQARVAEDTIRKFKNEKNTIRPGSLRKLTRAIHDLQNNRKPGKLMRSRCKQARYARKSLALPKKGG
jgi:hypothetical protein